MVAEPLGTVVQGEEGGREGRPDSRACLVNGARPGGLARSSVDRVSRFVFFCSSRAVPEQNP